MTTDSLRAPDHEPLAYVMRSGLVESVHHGSLVVLDADGSVLFTRGEPEAVMYARSAMKPVQATAMTQLGLDLGAPHLALAAASHSGEQRHLDGVGHVLSAHGLSEADLANPRDLPLDPAVRDAWVAAGREPSRTVQNCSGKHAAMLATCTRNGWPTGGYLHPDHPLQKEIARTVERLTGETIAHTAVDGCGAPLFAVSLNGLARAVRRIARGEPGSAERRVADAIRTHPAMLGGTGRPVTRLIEAVPGLIAKDGFEGVQVAAMPDGAVVAVKIADGSNRPRMAVTAAGLARCGVPATRLEPFLDGAGGQPADGVRLVDEVARLLH